MTERPILFSAPMIRALLAGTKTQTRRVVKPTLFLWEGQSEDDCEHIHQHEARFGDALMRLGRCPYGRPGDRLWVRETWGLSSLWDGESAAEVRRLAGFRSHVRYAAGPGPSPSGKLRPSIHMPRAASRISLEVTGVRVERLRMISSADAVAEGLPPTMRNESPAVSRYRDLWESINGAGSWDANPWVWVVSFKVLA